jgi:hypothetical protein
MPCSQRILDSAFRRPPPAAVGLSLLSLRCWMAGGASVVPRGIPSPNRPKDPVEVPQHFWCAPFHAKPPSPARCARTLSRSAPAPLARKAVLTSQTGSGIVVVAAIALPSNHTSRTSPCRRAPANQLPPPHEGASGMSAVANSGISALWMSRYHGDASCLSRRD